MGKAQNFLTARRTIIMTKLALTRAVLRKNQQHMPQQTLYACTTGSGQRRKNWRSTVNKDLQKIRVKLTGEETEWWW